MNKASKTTRQSAKRTNNTVKPSVKTTPSKARKAPTNVVAAAATKSAKAVAKSKDSAAVNKKPRAPRTNYKKQRDDLKVELFSAEAEVAKLQKQSKEDAANLRRARIHESDARRGFKDYRYTHSLSNRAVAVTVFILLVLTVVGFAS